jgi:hypothetical protein
VQKSPVKLPDEQRCNPPPEEGAVCVLGTLNATVLCVLHKQGRARLFSETSMCPMTSVADLGKVALAPDQIFDRFVRKQSGNVVRTGSLPPCSGLELQLRVNARP